MISTRSVSVLLVAAAFAVAFAAPAPASPPAKKDPDSAHAEELPLLDADHLFSKIAVTGAEFSPEVKALEGKRVRFRGHALREPVPDGGLFLTRLPHERLHPDDEETLPWDSVGVLWRPGLRIPPVPGRPTVVGTLRLGNQRLGTETVILVLEDAVPAVSPAP